MDNSTIVLTIPSDHEIYKRISRLERQYADMTDATQAAIDTLTTQVQGIGTDVATVQTNLQAEINALAAGNPGVDVSGLEAALAPLDGHVKALGDLKPEAVTVETPSSTDSAEAAPAVSDLVPAQPEATPVAVKAPYTHTGDPSAINTTLWTAADVLTLEGAALYNYAHDAVGGAPTGDGLEGFTVYTGATEPIPAS